MSLPMTPAGPGASLRPRLKARFDEVESRSLRRVGSIVLRSRLDAGAPRYPGYDLHCLRREITYDSSRNQRPPCSRSTARVGSK